MREIERQRNLSKKAYTKEIKCITNFSAIACKSILGISLTVTFFRVSFIAATYVIEIRWLKKGTTI